MTPSPEPSARLASLDAFRGITIAGMILVNDAGTWDAVYPPLRHAEWNGWTPTDLVFPFFLMIVGVAMTFSFGKQLAERTKAGLYKKVLTRSAIIFLLGLFLNAFPDFDLADLRIAGVLPRIAVVYLLASLIVLNTTVIGQAVAAAVLLVGYCLVMSLVPVPGHGAGVLTPEGNLAGYVDRLLLPGRMYRGTWDPEGILSTLPAVATTLLGVLTGHWIRSGNDRREIAAWMFVAGWAAILGGLAWDIWFPINKNLWTSSYTLFTAGAGLELLAVCYWLIDVKGFRRSFYPAIVFGMNPIAVYVLAAVVMKLMLRVRVGAGEDAPNLKQWIFEHGFLTWAQPVSASLAFAVAYVLVWFAVMAVLYERRIFIKI